MKTSVKQRGIHLSSQKANLVCDLVRNMSVTKALVLLQNTNKKAARYIYKLLVQAQANATNNHAMIANRLYIYAITANEGKTIKRMIPRAKGSSSPIRKRFVTLSITLSDDIHEKEKDLLAIKTRLAKRNQHKKSNVVTPKEKPVVTAKAPASKSRIKITNDKGANK